ncbi:hypothetical protein Aab01nite_62150 [Paractinoplanes abujensis]|nr:hypothetical protein Aab01nite_62150 [Actinoplanes abujensis]
MRTLRRVGAALVAAAGPALSGCSRAEPREQGNVTLSYAVRDQNQKAAMQELAAGFTRTHPTVTDGTRPAPSRTPATLMSCRSADRRGLMR